MLPGCCPSCGFIGEIEAFLIEPEAKRAIARVAALEPAIGKVIGQYLRLFGTGKRGLQLRRAVKLIDELVALVETGNVCADERVGVQRPASPAMWAAGIEQMITSPPSGQLENHRYLRKVVFGIADNADAQAERQAEEQRRQGRRAETRAQPKSTAGERLRDAQIYAQQMVDYGQWDQARADAHVAGVRAKLGISGFETAEGDTHGKAAGES